MADWNQPTNTSAYLDVLGILRARDADALAMLKDDATNIPDGAIRFVRQTGNKIQIEEWSGTAWVTKLVATSSGGFDSSVSLGSLAQQNSNNVTITGGSVAASTIDGELEEGNIPNMDASKIHGGMFNSARIPVLPEAKIGNLRASKIVDGQFDFARMPTGVAKFWVGTRAAYAALSPKDNNTIYFLYD